MKAIKAIELARTLGLSRRTVSGWCHNDPKLAYKKGGDYYIRISELAKRPGFDLVSAMTLKESKWIKAVDLAFFAGRPRRTIAHWCANRPNFAKRIGKLWYVDLEALGASESEVEALKKWTPDKVTTIQVVEAASFLRWANGEER